MTDETSWTMVEEAARGDAAARDAFSRLYLPVVRAYLAARWSSTPLVGSVDDAVQDVFVDLVAPGGALFRARRDHGAAGFRGFLYGVARNVARRHEEARRRRAGKEQPLEAIDPREGDDATPSRAFDRAWAQAIMREARDRHAADAAARGEDAVEGVELLRLRFQEGLPVRDIAGLWGRDPAAVHRQYRRARRDFAQALFETVARHAPGDPAAVRRECARLLDLLA